MSEIRYGSLKDFVFTEAVNFLKGKKSLEVEAYKKLSDRARATAFTVSGYTSLGILNEFLKTLTQAVEEGKTKKAFMDEMSDFLLKKGYKALEPFRAKVIFETNVQTAYNAGHYASMTEPTTKRLRPYWKYVTAGDGAVRHTHQMMDGRIYHCDDPIWNVWYPPNGFGCRCAVVSLSRSQVEGKEVSREPPSEVDMETGEIIYKFPDKGFSNNPGLDRYKPDLSDFDKNLREIFIKRAMEN